ncbi:MAG: hypothetical protein H6561_10610 [Lewinellaceae bacterium]|nr:hypothetical protein [Lewinellaceae bacterium]MCB9321721.1 hypothetical protein [Lewinellaceae bacterium]
MPSKRILLVSFIVDRPYLSQLAYLLHQQDYDVYHYLIATGELKHNGEVASPAVSNRRPDKLLKRFFAISNKLKKMQGFDALHFHYSHIVYLPVYYWWRRFSSAFVHTIWGSDFYRTAAWRHRIFRLFYGKMNEISFANSRTLQAFAQKYTTLAGRLHLARFGLISLDIIRKIRSQEHEYESRKVLGLPRDLPVVCLGYNATPAHQHIPVLRQMIQSYRPDTAYHVVLTLTYGSTSDAYVEEIKELLSEAPFTSSVFTDYLSHEDVARLRMVTDILIHVPVTDQLSAVFQEALFCGSHVIAGRWLEYQDLKNLGISWNEVDTLDEIVPILHHLIASKSKAQNFEAEIGQLSGWDQVLGQWMRLYG